jgi:hypothetical protein
MQITFNTLNTAPRFAARSRWDVLQAMPSASGNGSLAAINIPAVLPSSSPVTLSPAGANVPVFEVLGKKPDTAAVETWLRKALGDCEAFLGTTNAPGIKGGEIRSSDWMFTAQTTGDGKLQPAISARVRSTGVGKLSRKVGQIAKSNPNSLMWATRWDTGKKRSDLNTMGLFCVVFDSSEPPQAVAVLDFRPQK